MKLNENTKVTLTFGQLKKLIKESSSVIEMLGPPWLKDPPEYNGPGFEEWAGEIEKFINKLDPDGEFGDLCYRIENSYDKNLGKYTTISEEDREPALKDIEVLLDEEKGLPHLIDEIESYDSEIRGMGV